MYQGSKFTRLKPTVLKAPNQYAAIFVSSSTGHPRTLEASLKQFICLLSQPDYIPQAVQRVQP